ncbi:MAG: hypothetical protein KAV82_00105 [Phycisphaerae bacterium]|nr:hypothetical protein [Phycisphaerae bacterium]
MNVRSKLLEIVVVVSLISSPLLAGTISFSSQAAEVTAGTPITTDVVLVPDLPAFEYAFILIGSDGATDLDFAYHQDWISAFDSVVGPSFDDEGVYAQEVSVGGNVFPPLWGVTSLAVGTLTIDTTGMADGDYTATVDYSRDDDRSKLLWHDEATFIDPLSGTFNFTIVPEPAGPGLLALCALAMLRKRRGSSR